MLLRCCPASYHHGSFYTALLDMSLAQGCLPPLPFTCTNGVSMSIDWHVSIADECCWCCCSISRHYQSYMLRLRLIDFEDMQLHARTLLRDHPIEAASVREEHQHILVDEFQDVNPLQVGINP